MGVKAAALIEADGDSVGGQDVQVDSLAADALFRGQVGQQAVQQQGC